MLRDNPSRRASASLLNFLQDGFRAAQCLLCAWSLVLTAALACLCGIEPSMPDGGVGKALLAQAATVALLCFAAVLIFRSPSVLNYALALSLCHAEVTALATVAFVGGLRSSGMLCVLACMPFAHRHSSWWFVAHCVASVTVVCLSELVFTFGSPFPVAVDLVLFGGVTVIVSVSQGIATRTNTPTQRVQGCADIESGSNHRKPSRISTFLRGKETPGDTMKGGFPSLVSLGSTEEADSSGHKVCNSPLISPMTSPSDATTLRMATAPQVASVLSPSVRDSPPAPSTIPMDVSQTSVGDGSVPRHPSSFSFCLLEATSYRTAPCDESARESRPYNANVNMTKSGSPEAARCHPKMRPPIQSQSPRQKIEQRREFEGAQFGSRRQSLSSRHRSLPGPDDMGETISVSIPIRMPPALPPTTPGMHASQRRGSLEDSGWSPSTRRNSTASLATNPNRSEAGDAGSSTKLEGTLRTRPGQDEEDMANSKLGASANNGGYPRGLQQANAQNPLISSMNVRRGSVGKDADLPQVVVHAVKEVPADGGKPPVDAANPQQQDAPAENPPGRVPHCDKCQQPLSPFCPETGARHKAVVFIERLTSPTDSEAHCSNGSGSFPTRQGRASRVRSDSIGINNPSAVRIIKKTIHWTRCQMLGQGAHGKVYKGLLQETGDAQALIEHHYFLEDAEEMSREIAMVMSPAVDMSMSALGPPAPSVAASVCFYENDAANSSDDEAPVFVDKRSCRPPPLPITTSPSPPATDVSDPLSGETQRVTAGPTPGATKADASSIPPAISPATNTSVSLHTEESEPRRMSASVYPNVRDTSPPGAWMKDIDEDARKLSTTHLFEPPSSLPQKTTQGLDEEARRPSRDVQQEESASGSQTMQNSGRSEASPGQNAPELISPRGLFGKQARSSLASSRRSTITLTLSPHSTLGNLLDYAKDP
eukprot:gene7710-11841_t